MSFGNLLKNLDRGLIQEAKASRLGLSACFAQKAQESGLEPPDGHWATAVSKAYGIPQGPRLLEWVKSVHAVGQAFKEFGIDDERDTVGKVFAESTTQALFPVYYDVQAVAGILATSLAPDLCVAEIPVRAHEADHVSLAYGGASSSSRSGEGARATTLAIVGSDKTVKLTKYDSSLDLTYEAARMMRIDLVGVMIRRAAGQIGIDETDALLDALLVGAASTAADVSGTLDYDELVKLYLAFPNGYEESDVVINDTHLRIIFELDPLADAVVGQGKDSKGRLIGALGETFHRWPSTGSSGFGTTNMLAVDRRYATVQYTEGGVLTESDRLLDRQWEKTVISKWTGFGQLDVNAAQKLAVG